MWRNKLHTASQCFVAHGINAALYTFAIHVNRIFTYYPLVLFTMCYLSMLFKNLNVP